jgi:hypothetical protein
MQQGQVFVLKKQAVDGGRSGLTCTDRRSGFETVAARRLLLRA